MNEKYFFNDGIQNVPLISLFGASNEYIEDDSLNALYDRFLLRCHVDYIRENKNRIKLFNNFLIARQGSSKFNKTALTLSPTAFIDVDEIKILNEKCKEVSFTNKVLTVYNKLLNSLSKIGVKVSDRRKNESLKVLQATALLKGRDRVETDDFESLIYTLWTGDESQIQSIMDEIVKVSNPLQEKYNGFKKTLEKYLEDINGLDSNADNYQYEKTMKITESVKGLKFSMNAIEGILQQLSKEGKQGEDIFTSFAVLKAQMDDTINNFTQELMG